MRCTDTAMWRPSVSGETYWVSSRPDVRDSIVFSICSAVLPQQEPLAMRPSKISSIVRAGAHLLGCQPVDLRIAIVGEHDALLGIEHGQALDHVVEGGIELQVLQAQLLLVLLELSIQLFALGDVLVGADHAAIRHRPAQDGDEASVREGHDLRDLLAEAGNALGDELAGVDVAVGTPFGTRLQDAAQRRARLHLLRIEVVDLGKAPVGEHHALPGVEQAHALRHVVYCAIEAGVLGLERLLPLLKELVLVRQTGRRGPRAR